MARPGSTPGSLSKKRIDMETIEKKVADTILQRSCDSIEIDGNVYPIAPPTPATLILISELIAEMPDVRLDAENILFEVLNKAKDCKVLGKIAATLILGAKRVNEHRTVIVDSLFSRRVFSWKRFRFETDYSKKKKVEVDELDHLSKLILEGCTPKTLRELVAKRISALEISDFFGLTTSLSEANLLKRTKEVETTYGE